MNSYSVSSDEAMKQGDEVMNASSLQFLRRVKSFIAVTFKGNNLLTLHRRYFLRRSIQSADECIQY
jgi:hypothetical protein